VSDELFEKVIRTTEVGNGGGGLLNADQANRFIDYMWDQTVLAKEGRVIRMRSNTQDIDKVGVGQRLVRLATEAVDDGVNADATFTKVSITTKKLRLDWELSRESLEDNIEGADLEDHIARLMATQFGNDVEDLAINGDTTLSSDPLLKSFDGFRKLGLAGGTVKAGAGATISKSILNTALKSMPRKYLQRRGDLRFYTGSGLAQDYLQSLTALPGTPEDIVSGIIRGNQVAVEGNAGSVVPFGFGVPIREVPLFSETLAGTYSGATGNHGYVELTFPQNRIWGIKREVQIGSEYKIKKDAVEYTAYIRTGVQYENTEALVIVKDVKVA
jgi:Phage capsid family